MTDTTDTESPGLLHRLACRTCELYSLPAVALEVVQLTRHAEVDAETLRRAIEHDPALTAKLLRVVNSPLFAGRETIRDLRQAVARLGIQPLKMLVLGFSLPDELHRGLTEDALGAYWKHSLVKAVGARLISQRCFQSGGEDAFLAGLLQDVGMLVLLQQLGEPYARFLAEVYQQPAQILDLEAETLGFDHVALSARVLRHWSLPDELTSAVASPRSVPHVLALAEPQRTMAQSLHMAELLAQVLAHHRPAALADLLQAGQQYCRLDPSKVQVLVTELESIVPGLAGALNLALPGSTAYVDVLLDAYRQLAQLAEQECGGGGNEAAADSGARQALGSAAERWRGLQNPAEQANPPRRQAGCGIVVDELGLEARVNAAVSACRQARQPLTLLLIQPDDLASLLFVRGSRGARRFVARLEGILTALPGQGETTLSLGDGCFAVLVEGCERSSAVELARGWTDQVRGWSASGASPARGAASVSVGIATLACPSRNFPPAALIDAARRCLDGARMSGGDTVKSIEI